MSALTRRSDPEALEECWRVYYGDVGALRCPAARLSPAGPTK